MKIDVYKRQGLQGGGIMEIKKNFNLRKIAGEYILMTKKTSETGYNGLISLNEVEALGWKNLKNCENEEEILSLITITYMVKKKDARKYLDDFLKQLEAADII